MKNFQSKVSLIWNLAELLRGSWKQHEYQDAILPFVILKRLDCVLEETKAEVLKQYNQYNGKVGIEPILKSTTKMGFYNISPYDFNKLLEDQSSLVKNFRTYLNGFSENIQEIIEKFDFEKHLARLEGGNLLYLIIKEFNKMDLHPDAVSNHEMGYIFEELIRRFSEQSNETAGEHYTPREVIQMMVQILFVADKELLKKEHIVKTIYDPACGTGGMLTVAKDYIAKNINQNADIFLYGQELNPITYAIAKSDMLLKGEDTDRIRGGEKDHSKASTLSNDQFFDSKFDYMISNPPFGVDWKKDKEIVDRETERGFSCRFGAGTPRSSDGQLLFLQHMLSKMRETESGGGRIAIVFNGSPLFTGDAGGGESEIRRWVLENDWLEAIIALPDQLFYNTGISTYIWILTNRKESERKGKVQLIDGRKFFKKMRKSLGSKRNEISDKDREDILDLYAGFKDGKHSKTFKTTDFAFRQITIERPLRINYLVDDERLERVKNLDAFRKLAESKKKDEEAKQAEIEAGKATQEDLLYICTAFDDYPRRTNEERQEFLELFDEFWEKANLKKRVKPALKKAVLKALSERDEEAEICLDKKGNPETDSELRDTENVPYEQDIYEYFEKEVKPFVPDAWIDEKKKDHKDGKVGKVGYEIPVTRYFYEYIPPRPLEEIEGEIEEVENELLTLLKKL